LPGEDIVNKSQIAAAGAVVVALVGTVLFLREKPSTTPQEQPAVKAALPAYVGSVACAGCHEAEAAAWRDSQHAHAMQEATPAAVLADFSGSQFSHAGVASRFFRDGDAFKVHTDGPDGTLQDFTVRYTFGLYPLQQYLIEFPRGRLQSLTIAWDTRAAAAGGQRWFHLYPDQDIRPGNPLHWTGIDQNWNYQCADCHSTNLRKNYDAATDSFDTSWSEINVACEACHGPGEAHVAWAKQGGGGSGDGLTARLDERHGISWRVDPATGNASRSAPRNSSTEIEVCARCHSRRGQFSDAHVAGQPLHDAFRPALIEPGLYWPDGQMRDEVYNYASFLTSRMAAKGVTCADCHDPHSQQLRAPGNGVCLQCHLAQKFDTPAHHHHAVDSDGARCASCHMPTTTYMVVDPRHDHSFRLPRPDRSVSLGVPNACGQCHGAKGAKWAADAIRSWYPQPKPGFQDFAETFAATDRGDGRARSSLIALAEDPAQPGMVRASALWRLAQDPRPDMLPAVRKGLNSPDANVKVAAVDALAGSDPSLLAAELPRLLDDPIRLVRMSAARGLAGPAESRLDAAQSAAFSKALAEYVDAQNFNADRPEAHGNLGLLYAVRGDAAAAESEYRAALGIDPGFVGGWVNLADLLRATGREAEATASLREGLKALPGDPAMRHALGLSLVRSGDSAAALKELEAAAKAAPDNARYAYVYAIALYSAGKVDPALAVLDATLKRQPTNHDVLLALSSINLEAGRREDALQYIARLIEAYPNDPQAAQLLQSMR
jgi:predicted CXXCH cytochrome family protein